ncbi:DUF6622 family protein [Paraburkholderia flava]|uniref:DUF6622 family protein n=1 Tax=Paraburkholderia flava TaxID=2547393 RepID=UPI00106215AD|nr:DUF6622 family protein [Paraburkholderia flava]
MLHIPTYSIVVFAILIVLGVRRCYARTLRPTRLFVFPLVMAMLGGMNMPKLFPSATWADAVALLVALAVGASMGWMHASRWRLRIDAPNGLVRVPGDPALLVVLLAAFAVEFLMHYEIESHGAWAHSEAFLLFSFVAWGLLIGMSLGRGCNVFARYTRASTLNEA